MKNISKRLGLDTVEDKIHMMMDGVEKFAPYTIWGITTKYSPLNFMMQIIKDTTSDKNLKNE